MQLIVLKPIFNHFSSFQYYSASGITENSSSTIHFSHFQCLAICWYPSQVFLLYKLCGNWLVRVLWQRLGHQKLRIREIEASGPETAKKYELHFCSRNIRLTCRHIKYLKPISVGAHTLQKFYLIYNEAVHRMKF